MAQVAVMAQLGMRSGVVSNGQPSHALGSKPSPPENLVSLVRCAATCCWTANNGLLIGQGSHSAAAVVRLICLRRSGGVF